MWKGTPVPEGRFVLGTSSTSESFARAILNEERVCTTKQDVSWLRLDQNGTRSLNLPLHETLAPGHEPTAQAIAALPIFSRWSRLRAVRCYQWERFPAGQTRFGSSCSTRTP